MFSPIRKLKRFLYFRNLTRAQHRELLRDAKRQMKETKDKNALYRDMRARIASSYTLDKKKRAAYRFSMAAIAFYLILFFFTLMFHLERNLDVTHPFVVATGEFFYNTLFHFAAPILLMPALVCYSVLAYGNPLSELLENGAPGTLITAALLLLVFSPILVAIVKSIKKRYGRNLLCYLVHALLFVAYFIFLFTAFFYNWSVNW